jgi:hypothetical protein
VIRSSRPDAVLVVGDEPEAAAILKQMRAGGMTQHVFGAYRTLGDTLLKEAGDAAEGFEAVYPYDPTRKDPRWLDFNSRFENRFNEKPEQFAAMAYDTMNMLLDSICKAGLNRARIHDALADIEQYDGVTGHFVFDPNQKNTAALYLGTVHNGAINYRVASVEKASAPVPYARVGEDGVEFNGPRTADVPAGPVRVVVFGPDAKNVVLSPKLAAVFGPQAGTAQQWQPLTVDSNQNWGAASTQLVHALKDDHALAIIALDRDAGHLSEQLALKSFIPVIALADDKTLTSINVPWIFRLPAGTDPALALCLLQDAVTRVGANPGKVRNLLASGKPIKGVAFLATGEPGQ